MPATPMKNLIYRAALPMIASSVRGRLALHTSGHALADEASLRRVLVKNHVHGACVLLTDGNNTARCDASVTSGEHQKTAAADTFYRVASITKTAAALVALRIADSGPFCGAEVFPGDIARSSQSKLFNHSSVSFSNTGLFSLNESITNLLPHGEGSHLLAGVTLRHLLSHTSGLRDTPALDAALARGDSFHSVLTSPGCVVGKPGESFAYSNFGFGLIGCIIEHVTGKPVSQVFDEVLFKPLGMRATLDGSTLDESKIMPITRILSRRKQKDVTITRLGRIPLDKPDPLRHFGHTAGAMYTDAPSLSRMLSLIAQAGKWEGRQLISPASIRMMTREHASYGALSPTMRYGLGLILIDDPSLSEHTIIGHQGFAYGCVDGAFMECETGRQVISLNGGASEARIGRIGCVNLDMLRYALRKEMCRWK